MDKKTKRKFPCLFVLEGGIRLYDQSMSSLHVQIAPEEWGLIVGETVRYHLYMKALKEVGMPALGEKWTKLFEYFLRGLEVNISRMRNIDAILVASIDNDKILKAYKDKMSFNAEQVKAEIEVLKEQIEQHQANDPDGINIISDM